MTAAAVNLVEGAVVAGAMYLLGMPHAVLWGALVALLEFIPYLGPLVMVGLLGVAALTTFPDVGHALLVPATFLAINTVQANLVSPLLLGRRLALHPVAVFVSLAFWFWIWGVPGAFIAVPLLATFKIFCDHIDALAGVGEFLSARAGYPRWGSGGHGTPTSMSFSRSFAASTASASRMSWARLRAIWPASGAVAPALMRS